MGSAVFVKKDRANRTTEDTKTTSGAPRCGNDWRIGPDCHGVEYADLVVLRYVISFLLGTLARLTRGSYRAYPGSADMSRYRWSRLR